MPVSKDRIYVLLQECAKRKDLAATRRVHSLMVSSGLDSATILIDHCIRLFASCRNLLEANLLFCKVVNPSVYTWHAIISAHVMNGESERAIELYHKMQQECIVPDKFIFTCILKACGSHGDLGQGKLIHDDIISNGYETDMVVANSLIDMYAKCKDLKEAHKVFYKLPNRDVVCWSTMIAGYAQHGYGIPALELFQEMQFKGIKPDRVMYLCILKACQSLGAANLGKVIHDWIINSEFQSDITVGNTLIDMYAKCGSLDEAQQVFEDLLDRDVVSWGAIIGGFVQHGYSSSALEFFEKMLYEGIKPDRVIFLCTLKSCSSIQAVEKGRVIHEHIIRSRLDVDVVVGSTLIDMYAKCGSLEDAHRVLAKLCTRNAVSWNAIIGGYAEHGDCMLAFQCLEDMQQEGLQPVASTYTTILTGCSQAGHVKEGYWYFKSMREDHGIIPSSDHFNCMVDILGRAGRLREAKEVLESMPIHTDISGWMSLLTSCRKYGNVKIGKQCFAQVVQLDPTDASGYVLMSSIYADAEMWEQVDKLHDMRNCAHAWKKPGQACIEIKDGVNEFFVGDVCHPQIGKIYNKQNRLRRLMKWEGHIPNLNAIVDSFLEGDGECFVQTL